MIRNDCPDHVDQSAALNRSPRSKHATNSLLEVPFMQRPTCTIKEACKASGMGRTKFYELIKGGEFTMIHVGRRRLVQVPSLLRFLKVYEQEP
jgi:excisionase family DNA binding protein